MLVSVSFLACKTHIWEGLSLLRSLAEFLWATFVSSSPADAPAADRWASEGRQPNPSDMHASSSALLAAVRIMPLQCGVESDCPLRSSILAEGIAVSLPALNWNDFRTVGRRWSADWRESAQCFAPFEISVTKSMWCWSSWTNKTTFSFVNIAKAVISILSISVGWYLNLTE